MTQKEINEFLANTKVYVNGKSEEIQKKLFSFGHRWLTGGTEVNCIEAPFLYINKDHYISLGLDMYIFTEHEYREISAEEILSLEITDNYRPFKDKEECWNEMKKHEPFGYVKSKGDGSYIHYKLITKVSNSTTVGKVADCVIEFHSDTFCYHDMVNLYDNYTFADGTPFGIKED